MKSNVIPKPVEDKIKETLYSIFRRELPDRSEQIIAAMVRREMDKIKTARAKIAVERPIEQYIREHVANPLHDLGAENIRLEIFETEKGRLYELHFETVEESDYTRYCRAYENGGYFPDPRD